MFERYAIFYTPTGPLAAMGAAWLGWDSATGSTVTHPDLAGVDVSALTATPRKYGFHATLKAPFRLAQGVTSDALQHAAEDFSRRHAAFDIGTLALRHANGFVALRPERASADLQNFAGAAVRAFDSFRAPLTEADIARRRKARLTPRQDRQMQDSGYPYIFEDFHFHMTLSGRLPPEQGAEVIAALTPHLAPAVPDRFIIEAITLMGEDAQGMFHQIHRYTLTG